MLMPYSAEKELARRAVVRAADLCRRIQTDTLKPSSAAKADRSPVTLADYAAQAVICQALAAAFPADPVVAEEKTADLRRVPDPVPVSGIGTGQQEMLAQVAYYVQQALPKATLPQVCAWIDYGSAEPGPRFWTLDPVDGTKGFLRGGQYAIALALVEDGQARVSALACPNLPLDPAQPEGERGVVFLAVCGQGAEMTPLSEGGLGTQRIAVAPLTDPSAARFAESVEAGHTDQAANARLARSLGITQPPVRMDSQVKYGVVARGEAAIYLRLPSPQQPDYRENIWDHAAGALIVHEAGGRVTDIRGADLDFGQGRKLIKNQGAVVSNGHLHPAILKAVQDTGAVLG
jgi:3'(2'), 5'-bisphosphate nucleotidase